MSVLHAMAALTQRRRMAAVASLVMGAAAATIQTQKSGPQGPKRARGDFSWSEHVDSISATVFRKLYRMDHVSFRLLLDMIRPAITTRNKKQAKCSAHGARPSSDGAIADEVKLAVALR